MDYVLTVVRENIYLTLSDLEQEIKKENPGWGL